MHAFIYAHKSKENPHFRSEINNWSYQYEFCIVYSYFDMICETVNVRGVGVKTEVFHLGPQNTSSPSSASSSSSKKHWHTFFAPGNPGCLFYYLPWLQDVHRVLTAHALRVFGEDVQVYIHGLSHANHHFLQHSDGDDDRPSNAYDLDFQKEHFEQFVHSVLDLNNIEDGGEAPMLSFLGHSIGAYIVLDMLEHSPQLAQQTISVQLLMPFITWKSLPALHKLQLSAFHYSPKSIIDFLAGRVFTAIRSLSVPRRTQLIRAVQGDKGHSMDEDCVSITAARLFSTRQLHNFLSMGRAEIAQVPLNEQRMMKILARLSGKIRVFALYTDNDIWAPEADAVMLKDHAPYVATAFVPHLPHAFAMQKETYLPVTTTVEEFTRQTLERFDPISSSGSGGNKGKGGGKDARLQVWSKL